MMWISRYYYSFQSCHSGTNTLPEESFNEKLYCVPCFSTQVEQYRVPHRRHWTASSPLWGVRLRDYDRCLISCPEISTTHNAQLYPSIDCIPRIIGSGTNNVFRKATTDGVGHIADSTAMLFKHSLYVFGS